MATREIEWQFETPAIRKAVLWLRRVAGLELGRPEKQVDRYFDTPDHMLLRAGRTLRVRKTKDGFVATLKSLAGNEDALRSRVEIEEALDRQEIQAIAPHGRIARQVRQIVGRTALVPLTTVTTYRRKALTRIGGIDVEVAVDRFEGARGERRAACTPRIEIEVSRLGPTVEALVGDLAAACALVPAVGSKPEAAILALGIEPEGVPPKRSLLEQTTLGDLVAAIIGNQRRALWANEPIARLGEDPEGVHDMRVALRRLRTALKVFGEAVPAVDGIVGEIEWLGDVLSSVRDLDVLLTKADGWPEAKSVRSLLLRERRTANRALVRALDSRRYRLLVAAIDGLEARGPAAEVRVDSAAADVIGQTVKKARKSARAAQGGEGDDVHRLRRRLKRLRYAVEFLSGAAPEEARQFLSKLTKLQDALGEFQDLRVQASWEDRLAAMLPEGALSEVAAARLRREAELYKQATKAVKAALGKPYDEMHDALVDRCVTAWRSSRR